jgi:hypothetical protein
MAAGSAKAPLRVAVLLGTTRTLGPPQVLGHRVGRFVASVLAARGHNVDVVDPIGDDALPLLQRPHFAYKKGGAPHVLEQLAERLKLADCYVTVTPECVLTLHSCTAMMPSFGRPLTQTSLRC